MSLKHLMTNYAASNAWANETMATWLKTKPAELLMQEIPSSFSSILKTLNHISATEEFWHSVVAESLLSTERYGQTVFDADEVMNRIVEKSKSLAAFVASLSEDALQQKVYLDTPWVKGEMPRFEFLQHVFNHSTYHRGQITTIGRNVGITDAPMTDYNFYNMAVLK